MAKIRQWMDGSINPSIDLCLIYSDLAHPIAGGRPFMGTTMWTYRALFFALFGGFLFSSSFSFDTARGRRFLKQMAPP